MIDELLEKEIITQEDAKTIQDWADQKLSQMMSGGLMFGIVTQEEATKIPFAYKKCNLQNDIELWRKALWLNLQNPAVEPDIEQANKFLEEALQTGVDLRIEYVKLKWFYERESAVEVDRKRAFQYLEDLCSENDKDSEVIYFMSLLTTGGFGVEADLAKAVEYLKKASELEHADSIFELYIHYMKGIGVEVDPVKAVENLKKASELNHDRAMYNLGAMFASGKGAEKDMEKAIEWYEKAADLGNPNALIGLAVIYAEGDGVEQDLEYAEQLLGEAEYEGADVDHLRERFGFE